MPDIEERVDKLEELVGQTQLMLQGLAMELRRDTRELKNEMKQDRKAMNKKWEDLIKKLGTLVEDIVVPNIEWIGAKYFNLKNCNTLMIRVKKRFPKEKEFDVIAIYTDKIILNETKSNPKPKYAAEFIEFIESREFFQFFPEYQSKELIPIFASLHIPDNVLKQLSKHKIYAMGMKEDTMEILNPEIA